MPQLEVMEDITDGKLQADHEDSESDRDNAQEIALFVGKVFLKGLNEILGINRSLKTRKSI